VSCGRRSFNRDERHLIAVHPILKWSVWAGNSALSGPKWTVK
jgi:hypothetical protein